jgi:hypothetical protein
MVQPPSLPATVVGLVALRAGKMNNTLSARLSSRHAEELLDRR